MSFLSERVQSFLVADLTAGTSVSATNSASVNLSTYDADSVRFTAIITNTTGTGFTMTAQGGATTSALGGYCVAAGSTSSLLTFATTKQGKIGYIDIKNAIHKFVNVKYTALGATNGVIIADVYDSKTQPMALSSDMASTVSATGFYTSVSPTTA